MFLRLKVAYIPSVIGILKVDNGQNIVKSRHVLTVLYRKFQNALIATSFITT